MRASFLVLALLGAFATAARAQSGVIIYGSFDAGLRYQTNVDGAGNSRLTMSSTGTYSSNRFGFKGKEDLGDGMDAHFTLENGFNSGTGALNNSFNRLFERTASVGLGGTWGTVDLGRQYTNAFQTIIAYDPFSFRYPTIALGIPATLGIRFDNDIQYARKFGPISARAEWAFGEVPGNSNAGSAKSIGVSYKDGPLAAGAVYTDVRSIPATSSPSALQTKHWSVGSSYTLGAARLTAGYVDQKAEQTSGIDTCNKWMWVGINYNVTPALEITPAWYRNKVDGGIAATLNGKKDLFMLNAAYALSKRTNLYALIDTARLTGALRVGTAPTTQDRQTEVAVGINHLF